MLFITDAEFERIVSRFRNRQIAYRYFSYHCVTRIRIEYRNDEYIIDGTVMVNGILYTPRIIANQFSKLSVHTVTVIFLMLIQLVHMPER